MWDFRYIIIIKISANFLYYFFVYCFIAEGAEKDFNSKRDKLRKDFETKLTELNDEKKNIQQYKDQIAALNNQVHYTLL